MVHHRRMRLPRLPLIFILAVLFCTGSATSQAAPASTAPPLPPTGDGAVHRAGFMGSTAPATPAQLLLAARHNRIIEATRRVFTSVAARLHAANPGLILVVYENGMYSVPSDPAFPESWYMHDVSGHRIQSAKFSTNYLMDPLATTSFRIGTRTYHGWPQFLAYACRSDQGRYTSGCYLDALGPDPLSASKNLDGRVPVDPRTHSPWTPLAYETAASRVPAALHTLMPNAHVFGNGYTNGATYFGSAHILPIQAGSAEVWMGNLPTALNSWRREEQMLISSAAARHHILARAECDRCTAANVALERTYAVASYLLANNGTTFFDFRYRNLKMWQAWSPVFSTNLGRPLQTFWNISDYLISGGWYQRRFLHGRVLVNPGKGLAQIIHT